MRTNTYAAAAFLLLAGLSGCKTGTPEPQHTTDPPQNEAESTEASPASDISGKTSPEQDALPDGELATTYRNGLGNECRVYRQTTQDKRRRILVCKTAQGWKRFEHFGGPGALNGSGS